MYKTRREFISKHYKDCIKYLKKDNLDFVNEVKTKLEQIQSS